MAIAVKRKLTGSTDGRGIKVVATASPGTTIHTAVSGTTAGIYDEVWLYAWNTDTVDRLLTIEWGGTSDPDDRFEQTIPFQQGMILIAPGFILQNSLVIRAFAATANVIAIHGFANQIQD